MKQLPLNIEWVEHVSLDGFVREGNQQPWEAVRRSIRGDGAPVYLHGPRGVGKTHLLQAACRALPAETTSAYVPLDHPALEDPTALDGLEATALVALDRLGACAGHPAWEEALFHLFNRCHTNGTPLLMADRLPPAELPLGLADLASRLAWGLVLSVQEPPEEALRSVLQGRARACGLELPEATAEYLLRRYPRDAGSLMEAFRRLERHSLAEGNRLTIPFVRRILGIRGSAPR